MLFDTILAAFLSALTRGFGVLSAFSLVLFGAAAAMGWYRVSITAIRAPLGDMLAHALLMLVSITLYLLLLVHLHPWATGMFDFAAGLGARIGGLAPGALQKPSGVLTAGGRAVTPIQDFLARMTGWPALFNIHTVLQYSLVYVIVIGAFLGICLNIALTILEFHFALLCATVLLPWAPFPAAAFLAEFAVAWLVAMIVRMLVQTAVVGISIPLFERLVIATTVGGDPRFWESIGLVGGALFFFVLSWVIPNRVVAIAGRGAAMGIGGDAITAGFGAASRAIRGVYRDSKDVVTGVSSLLRPQRTGA
jgi:type IV secretory pathway TrbL component